MTAAMVEELLKLSAEERMELAQTLWDSVDTGEGKGYLPIPSWQRQILDERLADVEANPGDEESWESVEAQLWPRP